MKKSIKHIIPAFVKNAYHRIRKANEPVHGWFGDFSSWQEAKKKCSGYDAENILNKVKESTLKVIRGEAAYERDSVAFKELEYDEELLKALQQCVSNGELNIIDFGGALGSEYFQYRNFFKDSAINWNVVEQKHFVDCGNECIKSKGLKFYYTMDEAVKTGKKNALLLSSVLPYLEKPYDWIKEFDSKGFEYIIIDRNAFIEGEKDRLAIQVVPEFIYKASYPSWFFNEKKFLQAFTGYEPVKEFVSPFAPAIELDGKRACWKGYLLKKKK